MITLALLEANETKPFWLVFKEVLQTEFPGYSTSLVNHFLNVLYSESVFNYYVRNNYKDVIVAKEGNAIVGFAVIDEPYGGVSLCRWLGIRKNYQRKGIGSRLIAAWEELARIQHCHKMEVAAQPQAKGFYEKTGLKLEGKREKSYFGIDQYIFGKVIGEVSENTIIKK